jgi:hypothetical protein
MDTITVRSDSPARTQLLFTTPVSPSALIKRVNRRLSRLVGYVHRTRDGTRARQELGEYYVVGVEENAVIESNADLEQIAREIEALQAHEYLLA